MLELLNKIYRKDKVTIDIIDALKVKLTEVEDKINDIYKQIFLDYSTWYLELKEKEMNVSNKFNDIDQRRDYVRTRLLGTGTATKEMLESVANAVQGVQVEILFDYKNMHVTINFLEVEKNKYLGFVRSAVAEMMPYHLDLDIKYEHVKWEELKNVTWSKVKPYTWGSVAESVSGTVGEGLDDCFD